MEDKSYVDLTTQDTRQNTVATWVVRCFGSACLFSIHERVSRFIEEACELAQACGFPQGRIAELVEHVYRKPIGEVRQEVGGTQVALEGLAASLSLSVSSAANDEVTRITNMPAAHLSEGHARKVAAGIAEEIDV